MKQNRDTLLKINYIFIFCAILGMFYAFLSYHVDMDDFFITLRYAENIASGKGWVFNSGEKVLGTTTPLLTILVSVFIKTGLDAVTAVRILSSLFLLGTSGFCYLYFRHKGQILVGFASGLLLFIILPLKQLWGNEVPLCFFFLMGSLYFFGKERWTLSAVFQCLYTLSRMEGLLLFVFCTAILFWKKKKIVYPVLIAGLVLLVPWYIFCLRYFGDFLPNTLYAKSRQGTRPDIWISFSRGFFQTLSLVFLNKEWPFLSFCSLLGLLTIVRKRHAILLSWGAAHQIIYWLLGVPGSYPWYYYPLWLLYPILIAGGVQYIVLGGKSAKFPLKGRRCVLYAAFLCFLLYQFYSQPFTNTFYHNRLHQYREVAKYVRNTYPEHTKIIADEIGILGYHLKDYTILDTAGLIHKDIPPGKYFVYEYLVQTRNPELIINCLYKSNPGFKNNTLQPLWIKKDSDKKVKYSVEKLFPSENILVRILKKE